MAAFYSVWLNYTTVKDFAWADKYNPAAAPNRKVQYPLCVACRRACCILCVDQQMCKSCLHPAPWSGLLHRIVVQICKAMLNPAWQHATCYAVELRCQSGIGIGIGNSDDVGLLAKAKLAHHKQQYAVMMWPLILPAGIRCGG